MVKQTLHDLCWKHHGKYCDVVFNTMSGTWSVTYDNRRIQEGFTKRRIAEEWLKNYIASQG